jgi:hypothetical protein
MIRQNADTFYLDGLGTTWRDTAMISVITHVHLTMTIRPAGRVAGSAR